MVPKMFSPLKLDLWDRQALANSVDLDQTSLNAASDQSTLFGTLSSCLFFLYRSAGVVFYTDQLVVKWMFQILGQIW